MSLTNVLFCCALKARQQSIVLFVLHGAIVTLQDDYGRKFEELADTRQAYTNAKGLYGACLVMIDDSTLLMIGGRTGGQCCDIKFQL